ncbi:MAG TPA: hypothetical protein VK400_17085, partial [Pyrinomonadaceae bacterium]|nr:hypothetical protein [Pyrinomonadaceae bacterium]
WGNQLQKARQRICLIVTKLYHTHEILPTSKCPEPAFSRQKGTKNKRLHSKFAVKIAQKIGRDLAARAECGAETARRLRRDGKECGKYY